VLGRGTTRTGRRCGPRRHVPLPAVPQEALLVDVANVVLDKGEVDVPRVVGRDAPPPRAHQPRAAEDVGVSGPVEDVAQCVPRQRRPVPRRLSFHLSGTEGWLDGSFSSTVRTVIRTRCWALTGLE
jgi:hypothetical protein